MKRSEDKGRRKRQSKTETVDEYRKGDLLDLLHQGPAVPDPDVAALFSSKPHSRQPAEDGGEEGLKRLWGGIEKAQNVQRHAQRQSAVPETSEDGVDTAVEDPAEPEQPQNRDEVRRTVFVGNIPLEVSETKLRQVLGITKAQVESIRFRSQPIVPKFAKQRAYAIRTKQFTGTCEAKNAYVVLKAESDAQELAKKGLVPFDASRSLRLSSVSFANNEFSKFPRRSSVFVGNLYIKTTEEALQRAFEEHVGPVANVRIIRDKALYVSKGFGFVQLKDRIHVPKAFRVMHGYVLDGRPLNVTKAVTEDEAKGRGAKRRAKIASKVKDRRIDKLNTKLDKAAAKKAKKGLRKQHTTQPRVPLPPLVQ